MKTDAASEDTGSVWSVIVVPDGRVVSGSDDKSMKVWDLLLGSCVLTLTGHTNLERSVIVLPECRVVSGGGNKSI